MSYIKTGVSAGLILIGNELLSGKTPDQNMNFLAKFLGEEGIDLDEVVVIPDIEAVIVEKVRDYSARFDHVFTTGGIGPTHDDITAASIAKAFDLELVTNEEARVAMIEFYGDRINDSTLLMARMPKGSSLIFNEASIAPGFKTKNVHVMAGIPKVMQSMLLSLKGKLKSGKKIISETHKLYLKESLIAPHLYELDTFYKDKIEIGSYPFKEGVDGYGTRIVFRSNNVAFIEDAVLKLIAHVATNFDEKLISKE